MSIKGVIKEVVGPEVVSHLKGQALYYGTSALLTLENVPKIELFSDKWKIQSIISGNSNFFRGYYDINYFSKDQTRILCHRVEKDHQQPGTDSATVGFFDTTQQQYYRIADSKAWCWQQGSRLRWNPLDDTQILFNDVDGDHYCTRIYDLRQHEIIKTIPRAMYDLTPDMKMGFSLNYSRLQRLRPGYGYSNIKDLTIGNNAPEHDGLFSINLESGEERLMFSLRDLALKCDPDLRYEHYLNHISVSPDGKMMIFFHLYKGEGIRGWKVNLYSCNTDGSNLKLLESEDRASHYCWIDNNNMVITFHMDTGKEYYAKINIMTGKRKCLNLSGLEIDGHPNPLPEIGSFITDTYPLKYGFQNLYSFSETEKKVHLIARMYHDYRTRGEKRCDLHPSISADGRLISVDTTFRGGLRSVVILGQ